MAKQVFDMRVGKGMTAAQSNEHQRRWSDKAWEHAVTIGNYDRSREHLNFEIKPGGMVTPIDKGLTIPERISSILHSRGIRDPNEGRDKPYYRTVVNIIYSGDHDRMVEIAFGNQEVDLNKGADNSHVERMPEIERWAQDMYRFTCDRWGEENIAAFICHLDEKGPHIHCTLLPIDKRNQFAFKQIFAGRDKFEFKTRMRALHTAVAEVNAKWGLARGDDITRTNAQEVPTEEYRRRLVAECNELERSIQQGRGQLADIQREIAKAERRVKGLTTMVDNLTRKQQEIEAEIERLRAAAS